MSTRIKFVLLAVLSLLMTSIVLNPLSNASAAGENDTFSWYGTTYQQSSTAVSQYALFSRRADHLTGLINEAVQDGFHLTEIQGYYVPNVGIDPIRYDVVFDKSNKEQKYALSVTYDELIALNKSFVQQGLGMVFIRSHLVGNFLRFSVIWEKKATGFLVAVSREQVLAQDKQLRQIGFNLIHIDVYAWVDGRNLYNVIWEENAPLTNWYSNYTWNEFLTLKAQQADAGWEPIQVHAYDINHGTGMDERYDILFRPRQTNQLRIFDYKYNLNDHLNDIKAKRTFGFAILSQQRVANVVR